MFCQVLNFHPIFHSFVIPAETSCAAGYDNPQSRVRPRIRSIVDVLWYVHLSMRISVQKFIKLGGMPPNLFLS